MAYQLTFKRREIKYLMTKEERQSLLAAMNGHMSLDNYGRTTIRNVYYDTEDYRLIRRSIEKPVYKEKLRLRSYKTAQENDVVFAELKKKYQSVVYKRRLAMPEGELTQCLKSGLPIPGSSQIAAEINVFRENYSELYPSVFLSYEREAYYSLDGSDFRVTFDENVLYRSCDMTLSGGIYGDALLDRRQVLMEIKTSGGIPMWMVYALSEAKIYPTSFSKYGTAYQKMSQIQISGGLCYA